MNKRVLIVGACTTLGIVQALNILMPEIEIQVTYTHELWHPEGMQNLKDRLHYFDHWVYLNTAELTTLAESHHGISFPHIAFNAFHPDEVAAHADGAPVITVTQDANSAIGLWAYKNDLSITDTVSLFRENVFEELGYMDYWEASVAALEKSFEMTDIEFKKLIMRLKRRMPFMISTNHPNIYFLAEIARQIALKIGYKGNPYNDPIEDYMLEGMKGLILPYLPGVAERFGFRGALRWRVGLKVYPDVESYLTACLPMLPPPGNIVCERLDNGHYDAILARYL